LRRGEVGVKSHLYVNSARGSVPQFFRSKEPNPTDRQDYEGKKDLDVLQPAFRSSLVNTQQPLNEVLRNETKHVLNTWTTPPFHFDFVDSRIPNALAFRLGDFSFHRYYDAVSQHVVGHMRPAERVGSSRNGSWHPTKVGDV
jgi:hypothetical protein